MILATQQDKSLHPVVHYSSAVVWCGEWVLYESGIPDEHRISNLAVAWISGGEGETQQQQEKEMGVEGVEETIKESDQVTCDRVAGIGVDIEVGPDGALKLISTLLTAQQGLECRIDRNVAR